MIFKRMVVLMLVVIGSVANAAITDVSSSDTSFPAIKRSIDNGYFSLLDGTKFLPDQKVSRKEMAILLDRLDQLNQKASLSSDDIIQLKAFSQKFIDYLESQQNTKVLVDSEVDLIKNEQKTLNYDISRLEDHIQMVEKRRKEQEIYIWLGVGLGVLGLMK